MTGRHRLACAVALAAATSIPAATAPAIHVLKDQNCGCCTGWVENLQDEGFEVMTKNSFGAS